MSMSNIGMSSPTQKRQGRVHIDPSTNTTIAPPAHFSRRAAVTSGAKPSLKGPGSLCGATDRNIPAGGSPGASGTPGKAAPVAGGVVPSKRVFAEKNAVKTSLNPPMPPRVGAASPLAPKPFATGDLPSGTAPPVIRGKKSDGLASPATKGYVPTNRKSFTGAAAQADNAGSLLNGRQTPVKAGGKLADGTMASPSPVRQGQGVTSPASMRKHNTGFQPKGHGNLLVPSESTVGSGDTTETHRRVAPESAVKGAGANFMKWKTGKTPRGLRDPKTPRVARGLRKVSATVNSAARRTLEAPFDKSATNEQPRKTPRLGGGRVFHRRNNMAARMFQSQQSPITRTEANAASGEVKQRQYSDKMVSRMNAMNTRNNVGGQSILSHGASSSSQQGTMASPESKRIVRQPASSSSGGLPWDHGYSNTSRFKRGAPTPRVRGMAKQSTPTPTSPFSE